MHRKNSAPTRDEHSNHIDVHLLHVGENAKYCSMRGRCFATVLDLRLSTVGMQWQLVSRRYYVAGRYTFGRTERLPNFRTDQNAYHYCDTIVNTHLHAIAESHHHVVTTSHCHAITDPKCNVVTTSHCNAITNSHCNAITDPKCNVVTTSHGHAITDPKCNVVTNSHGHAITDPKCNVVTTSHCNAITNSHCNAIADPNCHDVTNSHGHAITDPNCNVVTHAHAKTSPAVYSARLCLDHRTRQPEARKAGSARD